MILNRRLAIFALAIAALPALASPLYFHVNTNDGNYKVYDLEKIDRLTFAGENMTIEKDGQALETIKRSALDQIEVNSSETGIAALEASTTEWYSLSGRNIVLRSGNQINVFDLSGVQVIGIQNMNAGSYVDVEELPTGIYVISNGKESAKIELR